MKLDPVTQYLLEDKNEMTKRKIDDLETQIETYKDRIQAFKNKLKDVSDSNDTESYMKMKKYMNQINDLKADLRSAEDHLSHFKSGKWSIAGQPITTTTHSTEFDSDAATKVLTVTAVITAAVVLGNKIYKNYFSKAAKACAGKTGKVKDLCMEEFKRKAVQAEISALEKAKKYCKKSKTPNECVNKLNQEIQKNKGKMK